jgi:hypothetical protein
MEREVASGKWGGNGWAKKGEEGKVIGEALPPSPFFMERGGSRSETG